MLNEAEFAFVAREVKARSGALLTKGMGGPIEMRLLPLARREGFATAAELVHAARTRQDARLLTGIADALLLAETRFFRDKATFARLKDEILPELARERRGKLRIWSAGCSTGQEAYSLAMLVEEMRAEGFAGADIVATDFSERLLDKARSGLFTQFEVQRGLPIRKLIAYFEKAGDLWRIADRLRAAVKFQTHNLLQDAAALGPFDVVLCCNVLSSFDPATRADTLERIADAMAPDGLLVLGANEAAEPVESFAFDGAVARKGMRKAA